MAPPIPLRVKLAVLIAAAPPGSIICAETREPITPEDALKGNLRFDHRPPWSEREQNPETLDTIPPANDPDAIHLVKARGHDIRTFGPGGEKRTTTLGSDAHSRAKTRRVQKANAEHEATMAAKANGEPKPKAKFKRKFPSRPVAGSRNSPLASKYNRKTKRFEPMRRA